MISGMDEAETTSNATPKILGPARWRRAFDQAPMDRPDSELEGVGRHVGLGDEFLDVDVGLQCDDAVAQGRLQMSSPTGIGEGWPGAFC